MTNNTIKLNFQLAGRKVELKMSVDHDSPTDQELLYAFRVAGYPEPEVSELMARVLRPGDFAIDGGANIGFFTVLMSKLVGEAGHIMAFEPGQNNQFKLSENVKLNELKNVDIFLRPLWDKEETVTLHMCADGGKNSLAPHDGTRGKEELMATALDNYVTSNEIPRLIKLDIEGVEEKALRGAIKMLGEDGCPYIVLELNVEALPKFGSSPAQICDFMREHGYSPFLLHPNGALPTYIPRKTKVIPNRLNWNVLFSTMEMVGAAWPEITV
jgi:FkbM family methyltransferase